MYASKPLVVLHRIGAPSCVHGACHAWCVLVSDLVYEMAALSCHSASPNVRAAPKGCTCDSNGWRHPHLQRRAHDMHQKRCPRTRSALFSLVGPRISVRRSWFGAPPQQTLDYLTALGAPPQQTLDYLTVLKNKDRDGHNLEMNSKGYLKGNLVINQKII